MTLDSYYTRLIDAYVDVGVALDKLPYTKYMQKIVARMGESDKFAAWRIWCGLIHIRDDGYLPRIS